VVQAPIAPGGVRLVPDTPAGAPRAAVPVPARGLGGDEEIRLTYRELTALIEDAVRNLK